MKSSKPITMNTVEQRAQVKQESAVVVEEPLESIDGVAQAADAHLELTDDDMPPIESLNADSDYSGFMSPKVSETLRRQALNKLFHLPHYNITDGLNDYDEDYTSFTKLGNIITHEMKRMMELEEQLTQQKAEHEQIEQDATTQDVKQSANSEHIITNEHIDSEENTPEETKIDNKLTENPPTKA